MSYTPTTRVGRSRRVALAAAAAAVAAAVALAACGSSSSSSSSGGSSAAGASSGSQSAASNAGASATSSTAAASAKSVTIGFVPTLTNIPFAQAMIKGAQDGMAANGPGQVKVAGPASINPVLAQKETSDLIASGLSGIAVSPFPAEAWPRALQLDRQRQSNLLAVNNRPLATSGVTTYLGVDDTQFARDIASETIKLAGLRSSATGDILLSQCVPGTTGILAERMHGLEETFHAAYPKATIISTVNASVDPTQNTVDWQNEIRVHPDPLIAGGVCDQDGSSLDQIKKRSGGTFIVFSFETPPQTVQGLADGTITAGGTVNWYMEGWLSSYLLARAARHQAPLPQGWVDVGYSILNRGNIGAIVKRDASAAGATAYWAPKISAYIADPSAYLHPIPDSLK